MYCNKCGKEVPESMKFCPECGADMNETAALPAKTEKPKKKKKWLIILIAAVVVIIIIAAVGGGKDESKPNTPANAVEDVDENAGNEAEPVEDVQPSQGNYKVGDTIDASGLKVTISAVETWNGYDEYMGPKDGCKIIRIKVEAKNESDSDKLINSYDFSCYVNNQPAEEYIWSNDDGLTFGDISSGREAQGYIYYQVPEDADSAEIEYETNYWTDKKAVFELNF